MEKLLDILLANWHAPKLGLLFRVVTHAWLTANEIYFELAEVVD